LLQGEAGRNGRDAGHLLGWKSDGKAALVAPFSCPQLGPTDFAGERAWGVGKGVLGCVLARCSQPPSMTATGVGTTASTTSAASMIPRRRNVYLEQAGMVWADLP
jgi:hypothetical protein